MNRVFSLAIFFAISFYLTCCSTTGGKSTHSDPVETAPAGEVKRIFNQYLIELSLDGGRGEVPADRVVVKLTGGWNQHKKSLFEYAGANKSKLELLVHENLYKVELFVFSAGYHPIYFALADKQLKKVGKKKYKNKISAQLRSCIECKKSSVSKKNLASMKRVGRLTSVTKIGQKLDSKKRNSLKKAARLIDKVKPRSSGDWSRLYFEYARLKHRLKRFKVESEIKVIEAKVTPEMANFYAYFMKPSSKASLFNLACVMDWKSEYYVEFLYGKLEGAKEKKKFWSLIQKESDLKRFKARSHQFDFVKSWFDQVSGERLHKACVPNYNMEDSSMNLGGRCKPKSSGVCPKYFELKDVYFEVSSDEKCAVELEEW